MDFRHATTVWYPKLGLNFRHFLWNPNPKFSFQTQGCLKFELTHVRISDIYFIGWFNFSKIACCRQKMFKLDSKTRSISNIYCSGRRHGCFGGAWGNEIRHWLLRQRQGSTRLRNLNLSLSRTLHVRSWNVIQVNGTTWHDMTVRFWLSLGN